MVDIPFIAPDRFESQGFVIRAYQLGDGAALRAAVNDSYEHLKPWMPWATPDQSVEVSEANCRRFVSNYLSNHDFVLGIWDGNEFLGGTGFHLRHGPLQNRNIEVGMWIRASAAGNGLGTQVLEAMLQWGFTDWGWERIVWKCDTRNVASARVAEKCGLTKEGTFRSDVPVAKGDRRDSYIYAILRSEWEQRKSPNT